ncbi:MAG: helix-turn-helix domain-containing protein [Steroidobacter sp.]
MATKKANRVEKVSDPLPLESELLTIDEVCARLKVSRPYLYPLLNAGILGSVVQGSRRFVTMRQLCDYIRFLEDQKTPRPSETRNNRFRPADKKQHRAVASSR